MKWAALSILILAGLGILFLFMSQESCSTPRYEEVRLFAVREMLKQHNSDTTSEELTAQAQTYLQEHPNCCQPEACRDGHWSKDIDFCLYVDREVTSTEHGSWISSMEFAFDHCARLIPFPE
ncbi:MAG: hypothetical protein CMM93_00485 [Rickettsiales bacterium]|nr:hypothetical protein [Rickettsiales bacterium]|tara:strand:+ start:2244 stop:2609 length:366 start_codon:yes stop_codon:yes gene_type:complete